MNFVIARFFALHVSFDTMGLTDEQLLIAFGRPTSYNLEL